MQAGPGAYRRCSMYPATDGCRQHARAISIGVWKRGGGAGRRPLTSPYKSIYSQKQKQCDSLLGAFTVIVYRALVIVKSNSLVIFETNRASRSHDSFQIKYFLEVLRCEYICFIQVFWWAKAMLESVSDFLEGPWPPWPPPGSASVCLVGCSDESSVLIIVRYRANLVYMKK